MEVAERAGLSLGEAARGCCRLSRHRGGGGGLGEVDGVGRAAAEEVIQSPPCAREPERGRVERGNRDSASGAVPEGAGPGAAAPLRRRGVRRRTAALV
ncbi:unnamed protein product [Lampetra planeri]